MLEKNMTIINAIDGTKLLKLQKAVGEINVAKAITYFIIRFSEGFNVGKNITSSQASMIAVDIMEKYPYETIEDVLLMFKQVRQGIIGDGKDYKLDGQNVFTKWFPEYLDKKYAEVELMNKKHQDSFKTENNAVEKFYANQREKKAKAEKEQLVKNHIDNLVKEMDRQMLEDTIIDWSKKPEMTPYLNYLKSKRKSIK